MPRHDSTVPTHLDTTTLARFFAKVRPDGGCWRWDAARNARGYGVFRLAGRTPLAHRVAYLAFVGPIPEGHELDHRCESPSCVNPAHLQPVPHHVNLSRARRAMSAGAKRRWSTASPEERSARGRLMAAGRWRKPKC